MEKKEAMMKLWKDTFHDSDEYIHLVFDNYYDPELCLTYEERGRVVAALMGVPYLFRNYKNGMHVKALYLCGLATDPDYRRKGIMTKLIEQIATIAKRHDYTLLFLIPANEGLRKYYNDRGFVDNFYQRTDYYTSLHYFCPMGKDDIQANSENNTYNIRYEGVDFVLGRLDAFKSETNTELRRKIIRSFHDWEAYSNIQSIQHTYHDWDVIIDEALLSGNSVYYIRNMSGDIVTSSIIKHEDNNEISVLFLMLNGHNSYVNMMFQMLEYLYPDCGIKCICRYSNIDLQQYGELFYWGYDKDEIMDMVSDEHEDGEEYDDEEFSTRLSEVQVKMDAGKLFKPYGMLRILNICEILKFLSNGVKGLKYSILVKEDKLGGKCFKYKCVDGIFTQEEIQIEKPGIEVVMHPHSLSQFLCRPPRKKDYVRDAFGLPELDLQIYLLLE